MSNEKTLLQGMRKRRVKHDDILKANNGWGHIVDGLRAFEELDVWVRGDLLSGNILDENGEVIDWTYCWIIPSEFAMYLVNYTDEIIFYSPEYNLYFWIEEGSCEYMEVYPHRK